MNDAPENTKDIEQKINFRWLWLLVIIFGMAQVRMNGHIHDVAIIAIAAFEQSQEVNAQINDFDATPEDNDPQDT